MYDIMTTGSLFVELTPSTPGEEITHAHAYTLVAGGAAANVVFALARLGMRVDFRTAVGDDAFAALLCRELHSFGIETSGVRRVPGQQTPVSFCAIDGQGGKQFLFYRFPGYSTPMDALTREDFTGLEMARLFDFGEGSIREPALREVVFDAARRARTAQVPVLYAMNLRKSSWHADDATIREFQREAITLADIIILNAEERDFLLQGDAQYSALHALGPGVCVVTNGGDGDVEISLANVRLTVPPYCVPVVYDVGAGDTFHAALVAAMLRIADFPNLSATQWREAVNFAAATAAIRVSTSADPHDLPNYQQVHTWITQRCTLTTPPCYDCEQ